MYLQKRSCFSDYFYFNKSKVFCGKKTIIYSFVLKRYNPFITIFILLSIKFNNLCLDAINISISFKDNNIFKEIDVRVTWQNYN